MELVVLAVVLAAIWLGFRFLRWLLTPSEPSSENRAQVQNTTRGISRVTSLLPESPVDLTVEDGIRTRVAGTSHWVDDATLRNFGGTVFWLKREPHNRYDQNAIAVYGGDRKIGYVPANTAEKYAPILDQIGTEFVVTRDVDFYAGDEFFLPRIPALRKLIDAEAQTFDWENRTLIVDLRPALTEPPAELTAGYPKIGGPHRNGDRIYGFSTGYARQLEEAGTPTISKLVKRTVTPAIAEVRIGDRLPIVRENGKLFAERDGQLVGQLSWDWDYLTGVMEVQRVFISKENKVVNCAGMAIPDRW